MRTKADNDCRTCANNDADVAGDSGACIMGHGLCDPPKKDCVDYVFQAGPTQKARPGMSENMVVSSVHEQRYRFARFLEHTKEIVDMKVQLQTVGLKHIVLHPDGTLEHVLKDEAKALMRELDTIIENQFQDIVVRGH